MDILLIVGIVVALVFVAKNTGAEVFTPVAPPPAPRVPSMPWANSFSTGVSVGIAGPDATAYGPNIAAAAAAAAPPPGSPPAAQVLAGAAAAEASLPSGPSDDGYQSGAGAAMGGASWGAAAAGQPLAGISIAPPPTVGPASETRSGRGHF